MVNSTSLCFLGRPAAEVVSDCQEQTCREFADAGVNKLDYGQINETEGVRDMCGTSGSRHDLLTDHAVGDVRWTRPRRKLRTGQECRSTADE